MKKMRLMGIFGVLLVLLPCLGVSFKPSTTASNFTLLQPEVYSASITGDSPPSTGDWTLTQNTVINGENLVFNGSIYVPNGLIFDILNSNITFSSASYEISVSGSEINIINSNLTRYSDFQIQQDSVALIQNARFENFDRGFSAISSQLTIENSTFRTGSVGIQMHNSESPIVKNTFIIEIIKEAILPSWTYNILIENCTLKGSGNDYNNNGIKAGHSRNITVVDCHLMDFAKTLFYQNVTDSFVLGSKFERTASAKIEDGELQFIEQSNNIRIEDNYIYHLAYDGIEIYNCSHFYIKNNTIEEMSSSFHIEHGPLTNITIINNTIISCDAGIQDVENLTITGNYFIDSNINLRSSSEIEVSYNKICRGEISFNECSDYVEFGNEYPCGREGGDIGGPPSVVIITISFLAIAYLIFRVNRSKKLF